MGYWSRFPKKGSDYFSNFYKTMSSIKGMDDSRFVRYFEKKVGDTVKKYRLCHKKEKIIVACSGGKGLLTA